MEDLDEHQDYLDRVYDIFVQWFVLPQNQRGKNSIPKDHIEFAEQYKISKEEALEFMQRPSFYEDLRSKSFNWAKQKTPELIQMLYEKIRTEKSATDLRLWLEMIESMNKKDSATNNTYNFVNISQDVQRQIAERAFRRHRLLPSGSQE